jgi:hypothetical protein
MTMSYCRFSSDNWQSDVYVYAHVDGGYDVHVASNRFVGEIPPLANFGTVSQQEWVESHEAQTQAIKRAEKTPIGLSSDGESFHWEDLQDLLIHLLQLRAEGYHVPDFALERIRLEIDDVNESTG